MALTKIKTQSINDDAITTAKINNNAVTDAKVADDITAGAATTAATLATARNIGGVSFNGSSAINLPGVNTAGSQDTTGNAATATVLATTRAINGVNFNGSAAITVTAAAGTLTGSTLASGVTASSLTSVGTLTSLATSGEVMINNTSSGNAQLYIKGAGTGTANSLYITDSAGADILYVKDNKSAKFYGTLETVGNATFAGDVYVSASGSPSFRVTDTTNTVTGKFQADDSVGKVGTHTNHPFQLFSNNTTALTVDTSQKVGIRESSPSAALHVVHGSGITLPTMETNARNLAIFEGDQGENYISIATPNTAYAGINFTDTGHKAAGWVQYKHESTATNDYMRFAVNESERLRITATGNVGIGTNSPDNPLEVLAEEGKGIKLADGSGNVLASMVEEGTAGRIRVSDAGTTKVQIEATANASSYINNGGKFGIGTASPDKKFHVEETVDGYSEIIRIVNTHATGKPYLVLGGPGDDDGISIGYDNANDYGWISHSGLNPAGNGAGIIMTADGRVVLGERAAEDGVLSLVRAGENVLIVRRNGSDGEMVRFMNGGSDCGSIDHDGSGTAYNTSSDYRLKENEVAISDGLSRLNQLKAYSFNFKDYPDIKRDGFFAHEVQSIVPYAVVGEKDAVKDDGEIKRQMIDQSKLVPLLVAAVQELSAKVETLENA